MSLQSIARVVLVVFVALVESNVCPARRRYGRF